MGVQIESEYEESRSLGEISELDDGKFPPLQSHSTPSEFPSDSLQLLSDRG